MLRKLAEDDEMAPYRSPFFFGLYAFEKDFVHVPDYVASHLASLSQQQRQLMTFLALITYFSQGWIAVSELKRILNISGNRALRLPSVLGMGPLRLLLHTRAGVRLVHPVIAEEVLRQLLTPGSTSSDEWKAQIGEVALAFVEEMARIYESEADGVPETLNQLFIVRSPWESTAITLYGAAAARKSFSELILAVPSRAEQNRILQALTKAFPHQAHYWNHLGRHHIYVMKSAYTTAELCLRRAIKEDEKNPTHHHTLGLVYRFEANRLYRNAIRERREVSEAFDEIGALIDQAEDCFKASRCWDPESEYAYISNIQLVIESVNALFRLSSCSDLTQFWTARGKSVDWAREAVSRAEHLLAQAKTLQAHKRRYSKFISECDSRIQGLYGRFDSMIAGLETLLQRSDVHQPPIRRLIAHAHLSEKNHAWGSLSGTDLKRVAQLMEENLDEDPTNIRDLRMWFGCTRRLETFDDLEAIARLENWVIREEEALEPHFYLYILYFLRWKRKLLTSTDSIGRHLDACSRLAGSLGRIHEKEWLAKEPSWCSLVGYRDIGYRSGRPLTTQQRSLLEPLEVRIGRIRGPQAGFLTLGGNPRLLRAFFLPGTEFVEGKDELAKVRCYLGFSYEGLRAHGVTRLE